MRRKIKLIIIGISGFLLLVLAVLIVSSMFYDKSNPRDRPNSYLIETSLEVDKPIAYVYNFVKYKIPDIYNNLTNMHNQFNILNAEGLVKAAVIECIEGDDKEVVHHRYIVTKDIENELIQFESTPSIIYDKKTNKKIGECNTYVYYDFVELDNNRTMLKQTVVIDMLNPLYKTIIDIVGYISGSRDMWDNQFKEELELLKIYIEK